MGFSILHREDHIWDSLFYTEKIIYGILYSTQRRSYMGFSILHREDLIWDSLFYTEKIIYGILYSTQRRSYMGFSILHREDLVSFTVYKKHSMLSDDDVSVREIVPAE